MSDRPVIVPVPVSFPGSAALLYELHHVTKTYDRGDNRHPALTIDHLGIPAGEIVAVLGDSGSGKSTLLNILGLLDRADPGSRTRVLFRGLPFARHDDHGLSQPEAGRVRREELGFVFQTGELLDNLDVASNIALPLHLNRRSDEARARVERLLTEIDLDPSVGHKRPNQLSVGQLQRVAFARAIAHDPEVLLADEPTGNLDASHAAALMETIRTWCSAAGGRRRSVVWVTHNISLAATHADRILILADGRVVDTIDNRGDNRIDPQRLFQRLRSGEGLRLAAERPPPDPGDGRQGPLQHRLRARDRGHIPSWFVTSFALQDLFPPAPTLSGRLRNGVGSLLSVTVTAVLLVMVLLMLRGAISLERYLEHTFVDPRINYLQIGATGRPGYRDDFRHEDVVAIRSMTWATAADGRRRLVVPPPDTPNERGSGGVIDDAHGLYNRQMSFEDTTSVVGRRVTLRYYAIDLDDPLLATIPVLEGTAAASLAEGPRRVRDLLRAAQSPDGRCEGIVLSPAGLQALGLTLVPDAVLVFDTPLGEHIPVLGVAAWLPAGKDFVMASSWFQHRYKAGRPLAQLPSYDLLSVYPQDIFDAWPIVDALDAAGYAVDTDILKRLDWVRSTSRFIDLAAWFFIAVVSSVALVSVFLTCTQTVRRKRTQLGILLAFGAPPGVASLVYLVEAALLFALAAIIATATHLLTGPVFESAILRALYGANPDADHFRALFASPPLLLPAVLAIALAAILATTWLATERTLHGLSIAELIRFRE